MRLDVNSDQHNWIENIAAAAVVKVKRKNQTRQQNIKSASMIMNELDETNLLKIEA